MNGQHCTRRFKIIYLIVTTESKGIKWRGVPAREPQRVEF
jgi:hypothetical protein